MLASAVVLSSTFTIVFCDMHNLLMCSFLPNTCSASFSHNFFLLFHRSSPASDPYPPPALWLYVMPRIAVLHLCLGLFQFEGIFGKFCHQFRPPTSCFSWFLRFSWILLKGRWWSKAASAPLFIPTSNSDLVYLLLMTVWSIWLSVVWFDDTHVALCFSKQKSANGRSLSFILASPCVPIIMS